MKFISLKRNIFYQSLIRTIFFAAFISLVIFTFTAKLTGEFIHECLAVCMLIVVSIHVIQNRFFFNNLRYSNNAYSALRNLINILLLVDFIVLTVTGILISLYLFSFIHVTVPFARQLHTFSAYFAIILIGAHLGLFINKFFSFLANSIGKYFTLAIKLMLLICVINGIIVFIDEQYIDKLMLQQSFSFFDYNANPLIHLINNLCVIILFTYVFYTITHCLLYILFRK